MRSTPYHSSTLSPSLMKDHRGRHRMVVGLTITYAISTYHHQRCELEYRSGDVYSVQHCVIKFASYLRQVGDFLRVLRHNRPKQNE
jgi:hypothetical protein